MSEEVKDIKQVMLKTIEQWYNIAQQLDKLKADEAALRPAICKFYFLKPDEGTNTRDDVMPNGWLIKMVHKINRTVDEPAMMAFKSPEIKDGVVQNQSKFEAADINADALFKVKYELVTSEYRKLTDEQRKIVDQVLIIKDGMPQLDVTPPSTRAPKNKK
jgi:hypothetical protein